jgi:hypothetical protein
VAVSAALAGALKVPTRSAAEVPLVGVAAEPLLNPPVGGVATMVAVVVPIPNENPTEEMPALGPALPPAAVDVAWAATAGLRLPPPHATHFASALVPSTQHIVQRLWPSLCSGFISLYALANGWERAGPQSLKGK